MLKKILLINLLALNLGYASAQESENLNNDCFNCHKCSTSNINKEESSNINKQHNQNNKKVEKKGLIGKSVDYSSVLPMLLFTNSF